MLDGLAALRELEDEEEEADEDIQAVGFIEFRGFSMSNHEEMSKSSRLGESAGIGVVDEEAIVGTLACQTDASGILGSAPKSSGSVSSSRILSSSIESFSFNFWVRLLSLLSSYSHCSALFILLHCRHTGRVPSHFYR